MGQLTAADFQSYDPSQAGTIEPGPMALYSVSVNSILPTQANEGFTEVDAKAAGFDLFSSLSQVESDLLGDAEPVVIGPGGQLYLLDGHHTFTALLDSVWGADDPTVYVNVVANFSNLSEAAFTQAMQQNNFLLPLNDGVPEPVSDLPTSLTGLTSDVYRGLEYSILKNKSSKLFTTTDNITGAAGASTPGLDKMTGAYTDFLEAAAYQDADGGNGLPYLSPGDIALATQWNLNPNSVTTLPSIPGSVTAAQLPGFILSQNLTINTAVDNATLDEAGTAPVDPNGDYEAGALAGNGSFTGVTEINAGTASNPILIGTPNIGFVMQLGNDSGYTVTLSNTGNTYTGGTSILAGRLVIAGDGSLGAAPSETTSQFDSSLTPNAAGVPDNVVPALQADNGIIFNSLSEGNGTLTIGTTPDQFTGGSPFVTNRPIAVGSEAATIDVNGSTVELNGPLVTLGDDGVGLGETTGVSNLTIDDLSSGGGSTPTAGTLILSTPSPYFYGDVIIGNVGTPTVEVMNDAALGSTTGLTTPSGQTVLGEVELNGGTLQTGGSFSAPERDIVLDGGSQIDLDGNTTTWGMLTDVKRTIAIVNSGATAGAITFNSFTISQTSQLQLDGSANGKTYSGDEAVTFTDGILQSSPSDTLFIDPSSTTALGTATEKLFSSGASTTLVNGMAPAWIIIDSGGGASTNPYNFVTYGANGYVNVTYTDSGSGSTGGIRTATSTSIVDQTGNATLNANAQAYALKINDGEVITATGYTIALGDGSDPAGLIMGGGSAAITGGTLAFGGSEAIIYAKGSSTTSSAITGSNGLVLAGSGTLTLSAASPNLSGAITIDSGELSLTAANAFQGDVGGLTLDDVKSHPSNSILNFTASQTFATLNSIGTKSAITFSGATLTIGDTINNLDSTLSSAITESGAAEAGALTFDGSGLFDLSGMSSSTLSLVAGSTIVVNNSAQLRVVASAFANGNFSIDLNGVGTQLQFAQNGGGQFANAVTGTGELHLIGGTLRLSEAAGANTYSGGTVIETGSTLDLTTNQVSTGNANMTDAGGLIVFDQDFSGAYSGVIGDGEEMGTGPMLSGSLDIDDSAADSASNANVTLNAVQTYSGATYVEAGTLTLGIANAVADSSGLTLGRVGGAVTGIVGGAASGPTYTQTANLVLDANQQLNFLTNDAGNSTFVQLNGNTLTLTPASGADSDFGGVVTDGSAAGSVVADGAGTVTLTGDNTFSGGLMLDVGTLELGNSQAAGSGAITFGASSVDPTLKIDLGDAPSNPGNIVEGFALGDAIDFAGVGLATSYSYSGGLLQLTGGSQNVQIAIAAPPTGEHFALGSDGGGGTVVTLDTTTPSELLGGPYGGAENAAIVLGLSVSVSPNSGEPLATMLSVQDGTLTVGTSGGATVGGNGTGTVTLSGTAVEINAALGSATYTGGTNFYGTDTLAMTTTDTTDETSTGTQTVSITVTDTTTPSETIGGPYSGNENAAIALGGLSVSASPNGNDPLSTVLSVAQGTLAVGTSGGATISGNGTGAVTLIGTAVEIDTALAAASYTGDTNFYGSDTLSMTTTDTADDQSTGAQTAGITVADTATIGEALPAALTGVWGAPIALDGISVSDNPNSGDTLSTVLKVNDGTIAVGSGSGATVKGNGTGTVTLIGTEAMIDAALAAADYIANPSSSGSDTLSVTTTDPEGHSSGTRTVAITSNLPSAPDLGLALGAGPTGALNETNLTDPLFAGVAAPFSLVLLYDGSHLEGAGFANWQGSWTVTAYAPLPLGTQQITATAYSFGGHPTTSAPATIDVTKSGSFSGAGATQNVNFQAGDGNNTLQWGNGEGVVIAGDGNNKVTAGGGMDVLQLGNGNNSVSLGSGNDSVTAGNGSNTVTLGNGNDTVQLASGVTDSFFGYPDNFALFDFGQSAGSNSVSVGNGNDTIGIGGDHNTLVLGNGDDLINLGGGKNTITLGTGTYTITSEPFGDSGGDELILTAPPEALTMAFNAGNEFVFANVGFDLGSDDGKGTPAPQHIAASLFSTNTNGTFATAGDRFAYNQATGNLYYDAQGNKAGSTVQLVSHLTNAPHLTAADLFFIS